MPGINGLVRLLSPQRPLVASGASLEIVTWGVYDLAKDGSTFNPGDKVYRDNVNLCDFGSPAPVIFSP